MGQGSRHPDVELNSGQVQAIFFSIEGPGPVLPPRPLPPLPGVKGDSNPASGPIMPIPPEIRPTLVKYRFEVLFWGLRDLKRVQFLTVDKPRVDVECGGHIIQSTVIQDANKNPNFTNNVRFLDVELPEQEMYCPPLSIRVVDCR